MSKKITITLTADEWDAVADALNNYSYDRAEYGDVDDEEQAALDRLDEIEQKIRRAAEKNEGREKIKYSSRLDVARSKAVIDALGGTVRVAEMFGVAHPSVSLWKIHGIPEARLQAIQLRFKKVPAVAATLNFQPWRNRKRSAVL